jgi:hypothetical protein
LIESDRFLLPLPHLVEPARGAHADLDGIRIEIFVLGLPRVGGHGNGFVADVFNFIDRLGFGERAASGVVFAESGTAHRDVASSSVGACAPGEDGP